MFPKAVVVDFWATYTDDLWEDHGDNYEIDEGITVIRTPSHSSEDASAGCAGEDDIARSVAEALEVELLGGRLARVAAV